MPHALHQKGPEEGLVVQSIGKLQARGIARTKLVNLGGHVLAHRGDLRLGVDLRRVDGGAAFLGHELILSHARPELRRSSRVTC